MKSKYDRAEQDNKVSPILKKVLFKGTKINVLISSRQGHLIKYEIIGC